MTRLVARPRHECKYLVSEAQADALRRAMAPFVELDPNAAREPMRRYLVQSLYFDTPDFALFAETREGLRDRVKLRIRSYASVTAQLSTEPDAPCFLEIKRRRDRLVLKSRARIERRQATALLRGRGSGAECDNPDERACLDSFRAFAARYGLRPAVDVRYEREAFVGRSNRRLRLTFDRRLACAEPEPGDACMRGRTFRHFGTRRVIFELKFDDAFPRWALDLVEAQGLARRSYSKYAESILHEERGLSVPPWRRVVGR